MSLKGNLRSFSATQLLNVINLARKTGTLSIKGEESAFLAFRRGKLIYASIGSESRDLPNILWQSGKFSNRHLRTVRSHAQDLSEKQVGRLLVRSGLLTQKEIAQCVRQHALAIASELLTWTEGAFSFSSNQLTTAGRIIVPVTLEGLLMDGERRLQEWTRLQEELPNLDIYLRSLDRPSVRLHEIQLTLKEWRVVACSNASHTIQQIAHANRLTSFQIRKIVYGLLQAGLVEIVQPLQPAPTAV
jgi:hypothetical protein